MFRITYATLLIMKLSIILAICVSFCFVSKSYNQLVKKCNKGVFQEKNGIVVFEAESIALSDGWSLGNKIEDYSGEGYITWMDNTITDANGQGLLSYHFKITKSGTYTVKLKNYHSCEDYTECNDIFVKMNNSDWRKNFNHTLSN